MLNSGKRAFELLKKLSYSRPSGSKAELKTAEALKNEIEKEKVDCHIEAFDIENSDVTVAEFTVIEPYQKKYEISGYLRSGSTPKEGLTLDLLYVESIHPMFLNKVEGKAVLVNGFLSVKGYSDLQKAGAAAIISFSGSILDKPTEQKPDVWDIATYFNGDADNKNADNAVLLNMHIKSAMEIVRKGASKVKINLQSTKKVITSHNVCARINGTEFPNEIISFGAHYDSVASSMGAYDNMSGSVALLEVMQYFVKNPPRRTLEFNWFGSEEPGLLGSRAYTRMHEKELENHLLMLNVDMVGVILGRDCLDIIGADSLKPYIDGILNEMGFPMHTKNNVESSDCVPFSDNGIPSITFCRDSAKGAGFIHNRNDNQENCFLSAESIQKAIVEIIEISKRMINAEKFPVERIISKEMRDNIDKFIAKTNIR